MLAGTNPAVMMLRSMILQGRVSGEQAAQLMSVLPGTIQTPTDELLANLFVSSYLFIEDGSILINVLNNM